MNSKEIYPRPADVTHASSSALPSSTPRPIEDPYSVWLAEQKTQEKEWASNRAAKKAKLLENDSAGWSSGRQSNELSSIKKQLEAKTEECALLKNQLRDLQVSTDAVKNEKESQEKLFKVSYKNKLLFYYIEG